jgi:signal transduction histidine kinase
MRLLLYQLRAPLLGEIGLSGALKQRLSAVEQRVGIQTHIYTHGDLEALPLLAQEELYFIAQEALNNALRHARASEIQIRLVKQNHHLELVVQDNGNGFEQGQISEGMGLRNMYARAQLIDAKIEIQSFPGQGTRVQLGMEFPDYVSE